MIDWDIDPLVRCGPLLFGSTRAEIGRRIGSPGRDRRFSTSDHREYRGQGPRNYDFIAEYDNDILFSITIPFQGNKLRLSSFDILSHPPQALIDGFKGLNSGKIDMFGDAFCFSSLGIVMNDWLSEDDSDKWAWVASAAGYTKFTRGKSPDKAIT